MKNFFFLDAVLSTKIITLIYWLMLMIVWVLGIAMIVASGSNPLTKGDQGASIFSGVFILFFGTLIARLWSEFMVVIFKIQQNTRQTAELLRELKGKNILYSLNKSTLGCFYSTQYTISF